MGRLINKCLDNHKQYSFFMSQRLAFGWRYCITCNLNLRVLSSICKCCFNKLYTIEEMKKIGTMGVLTYMKKYDEWW